MKKAFLCALVVALIFNLFFFHVEIRLGALFLAVLLNGVYYLNRNEKSKNLPFALTFSAFSCIFAFLIGYRGNGTVQFVDLLAASFFSSLAFYFYKYQGDFFYNIVQFLFIPFVSAKESLISAFDKDSYTWSSTGPSKNITNYVTKGLIIAVPLFVVILMLLISADPIFAKYANIFVKDIGERAIISLIVFGSTLVAAITSIRSASSEKKGERAVQEGKFYELMIVASSIGLLLLIFILFQIRYLFTTIGERELHTLGIAAATYSEYVRNGFFQLIFVAVIVSAVILYITFYLHSFKNNVKRILQVTTAFLTLETVLLIVSDAKRLHLYMTAHGLSEIRIFGIFFLVWLSLLVAVLFIQIIKKDTKVFSYYSILTSTILVLLALNIFNMDEYIVLKHPPTVNNKIDYTYMVDLSTDAYKNWPTIVKELQKEVVYLEQHKDSLKNESLRYYDVDSQLYLLERHIDNLNAKYPSKTLVSFNITDNNAYNYVHSNSTVFKVLPDLRNRLNYLNQLLNNQQQAQSVITVSPTTPISR